ncbi:GspE family protein [Staphylococcus hyicus]|uniref:GspE family protein n=1 Tax=Staphylococcus hyicus TaxID=1284 RepID=UPI00208ED31C|nr:GspE family protein [Staphylococcus hyicus]MCO4329710.1 GspE family protein [Staphylococcus hyicus]
MSHPLIEMGITKQDLLQALNLIVNQRLITTNDNSRKLVYELMSQDDIRYFLDHNFVLPKHFESLNDKLTELKKKGEIDDVTLRKYQK